ncbi:unnamed protein product [Closterium sp. NIES-53]
MWQLSEPELRQDGVQVLLPQSRHLLDSIEGFLKEADGVVSVLEGMWLLDEDDGFNRSVHECTSDVDLTERPLFNNCDADEDAHRGCRDFRCHGCLPFLTVGARQGLANGGRFLGGGVANSDGESENAETGFVGLLEVEAIVVVEAGYFDNIVVTVVAKAEGVLQAAPPSPSRPPATTAAARATTAAGGGAAGSTGGAVGAGGARPTTYRHCLSWPLSRQLQRLGLDNNDHCLSQTTPPLSSFVTGLFSEVVLAAALGSSESVVALGAGESAAALGACESADALGARASTATCPASAEALHTFTLDSGASRCFFRDCTTVTPLASTVPVSLADPTGGPVAESGQVVASSWVSTSGQLVASCSCRILSHQTHLWHHRLGHPSLPRLRSMLSRLLASGLPRSLPSLLRSPTPPCLPYVKGWQRAAPHSSEFPPTTAPV